MPTFKSKAECDSQMFLNIPQDDYELHITNIEPATQNKYMAQPVDGITPQENILKMTLTIIGCRDGEIAKDENGVDLMGTKVFFTANPERTGFKTDGTPSMTRSLVANALGIPVESEIVLNDWNDLLSKTVFAEIMPYTNKMGKRKSKITRFLLPPKNRKVAERAIDPQQKEAGLEPTDNVI